LKPMEAVMDEGSWALMRGLQQKGKGLAGPVRPAYCSHNEPSGN
jgi:hypothetical protein